MAGTFHGGIAFQPAICDLGQVDRPISASMKLIYRLDECSLKVGDRVAGGDLLGSRGSLPVRASLSGKVTVTKQDDCCILLTLESDGKDRVAESVPFGKKTGRTLAEASAEDLLEEIASSGIVEQSGESLHAHLTRALACAPGKLRIAAVSCLDLDPLSATNSSIVEESAGAVAGGLTILLRLLRLKEGAILCDSRRKACIKAAEIACADSSLIAIEQTSNRYPQADPRLITRWLTNKELSPSKLPEDAGLFLTDAETCASLYRLFAQGLPNRFKRLSIFADGKLRLCDLPFGLELSTLPSLSILPTSHDGETLCRGGMDGRSLPETVDATLNGIALLPQSGADVSRLLSSEENPSAEAEELPKQSRFSLLLSVLSADSVDCIACGRCADVCPMFLLPYDYLPKSRLQRWLSGSPKDGGSCMGCGCCSYICPARLPLRSAVQSSARKEDRNGK